MAAEQRPRAAAPPEQAQRDRTPDVVLDVPRVAVEEIVLSVDALRARVALDARLAGLVHLHVGADAEIRNVSLELRGVEAEAHLRAHLDNVLAIFERALETVDAHPELLSQLAQAVDGATELVADGASEVARSAEAAAPVRALAGETAAEGDGEAEAEEADEPSGAAGGGRVPARVGRDGR